MKNLKFIGIVILGLSIASCGGSEEKKIEKKIEITDDNGETQIQITTTEDGVTKEESYSGAEADKKIKEIEKEAKKISKEVSDSKKVVIEKEIMKVDGEQKTVSKKIEVDNSKE